MKGSDCFWLASHNDRLRSWHLNCLSLYTIHFFMFMSQDHGNHEEHICWMWKTLLEVWIGGVGGDALGSTSCYNNVRIREEVVITRDFLLWGHACKGGVPQVGRGWIPEGFKIWNPRDLTAIPKDLVAFIRIGFLRRFWWNLLHWSPP
jgi:hypothetical protein